MDLRNMLGGALSSLGKKTKSGKSQDMTDIVLDNVDEAVRDKLPTGGVADVAEQALDSNKDGRIADDLLRFGQKFFKKK